MLDPNENVLNSDRKVLVPIGKVLNSDRKVLVPIGKVLKSIKKVLDPNEKMLDSNEQLPNYQSKIPEIKLAKDSFVSTQRKYAIIFRGLSTI